jgi:hypothetical protein
MPTRAVSRDGSNGLYIPSHNPTIAGQVIAANGDIRSILGTAGKNVTVCQHGDAIAVLFGAATGDPNDMMAVKIGYSIDQGATWQAYGPFTGNVRRIYGGTDGTPNFCVNPGECVFAHMMRVFAGLPFPLHVLIEENVPSAPSISAPVTPYWSDSMYIWQVGIAIAPDDPLKMITSGWSYLSNGDNHLYTWTSTDGGYTWPAYVDIGVTINPAYGGNCGPKLAWGPGGYVCGVFNNSVGGITFDGWPHFTESTDNGATWLTPVKMPVPAFDTALSQFWWYEDDAQYIDGHPWVLANDINNTSPHMWLFIGGGTPGARTWQAFDLKTAGFCSTYVADTLFWMDPSQYGNITHDPVSGMTMITYKCNGYIVQGGTNVLQNGACVGGIYTYDNGVNWHVVQPMSDWQVGGTWADWDGTETAHRLVNIAGQVYSYSIWIDASTLDLYFEGGTTHNGRVRPIGIEETNEANIRRMNLQVTPNVSRGICRATFNNLKAGTVTLLVYDATGRLMNRAFDGALKAGLNSIEIPTAKLTNGTYFVRLETGQGTSTAKFIKI